MAQDELLTVKQVAMEIEGHPARQTLSDWYRRGVRNRFTGEVIHLEMTPIGGRLYTTRACVSLFIAALKKTEVSK
jgi:hypothetical protein